MKKEIILLFCVFIFGCASNSVIDFSVKIDPKEGVDPTIARKIALNWMLYRNTQEGGAKISIFYRSKDERKKCFIDNPIKDYLGEFCGAKYLITTEYIKYVGLEAYYVIEKCENDICEYLFSDNFGLQE